VPVLGDIAGSTSKEGRRTELIVFITPKIIRSGEEAAQESQNLRTTMKNLNFE
jgi:general secretion pathway protein D